MGDFDSLLECRIGSSPLAGFTATDYSYTAEPQVREGFGRTGTKWSLTVEGYLSGADEAELAARQRAIETAAAVGGQDVVLLGLGGIDSVRLLASLAVDGGPHVAVQIETGAGALKLSVKLSGEGLLGVSDNDWEVPPARYTETTAKDVADRPTVRRRGSVSPKRGTTAREVFERFILPSFQRDYPRRPPVGTGPGWVVSQEYEEDAAGRTGTYTLNAVQLASEIPGGDAANYALDGTASTTEDRDEQGRRLKTLSFDVVVEGDPRAVYERLRGTAGAPQGQVGSIIRERIEITEGREGRLRGSFTLLMGSGGGTLLDWQQQIESQADGRVLASKSYPGIGPVFYEDARQAARIIQSGRAMAIDQYAPPSPPLFDVTALVEPPKIVRRRVSTHERETTWTYTFTFGTQPQLDRDLFLRLDGPSIPLAPPDNGGENGGGYG